MIVWHDAALRLVLESPNGPVGRDLARRAIRVESAAKNHATHRPGPRVQTGNLRSSITWQLGSGGGGLYADVATNVVYGLYLELGTVNMPSYPFLVPALPAAAG